MRITILSSLVALCLCLYGTHASAQDEPSVEPTTQETGSDEPAAPEVTEPAASDCPIDTTGFSWPPNHFDGAGTTYPTRVAFASIDFENNRVVLQNGTETPVTFSADGGWSMANGTRTEDLPEFTLAGHASVTLHLTESGTNDTDHIYLSLGGGSARFNAERGEFAVFSAPKPSGPFWDPAEIEAFVRWGGPPRGTTDSYSATAEASGLWTTGTFVATDEVAAGLLATGSIIYDWDWTLAPAECF